MDEEQGFSPERLRGHRWQEDTSVDEARGKGVRGRDDGGTTILTRTPVCQNVLHSLATALHQRPQTPKKISMMYIPMCTEIS
jgi:hypothetical protein